MNSPRRILSIKTVLDRVPYSRTTVWRKSRDPDDPFPSAVDIGPNRTGIYEDEFEAWLDGLSRRGASPKVPDEADFIDRQPGDMPSSSPEARFK